MQPIYAPRPDGSFVIAGTFGPYHVTLGDPLYVQVQAAHAAALSAGAEFPPEPEPPPIVIPEPPQPTRAELMAAIAALAAKIETLPESGA